MLRHGFTNAQITRARRTSADATKFHMRNIAAKLDIRGRIALRHWNGIPRASALGQSEVARSPQETAMTTPGISSIGQISIVTRDTARAEAFYRDVLGLTHLFTFGTLAFFDVDGTRLFITQPEDGEWKPSSVIYFQVPNILAAHEALAAQGVAFESAPHLIHRHENGVEEWMAFFRDPDENMLALMSQVAPAE